MKATRYILMLEDDEDDRHITETFFAEKGYDLDLHFLSGSNEVLPFLNTCSNNFGCLPSLIILDKNAPPLGSMEALKTIKTHPQFRAIPVIMISGTASEKEVNDAYANGVNSFIVKPATHLLTTKTIGDFLSYWFDAVALPDNRDMDNTGPDLLIKLA